MPIFIFHSYQKKLEASKISLKSLQALASQEDVSDIINLYEEFFGMDADAIVEPSTSLSITFGNATPEADPGVEVEALMSAKELASNLGFVGKLPLVFNRIRHSAGLTAWDSKHRHLFEEPNPLATNNMLEPITLHWHQLAGVHAVIRKVFSSEPLPKHGNGVLIADEVGLGKTFQALTVIAFLADVTLRKSKNFAMPPIIGMLPY